MIRGQCHKTARDFMQPSFYNGISNKRFHKTHEREDDSHENYSGYRQEDHYCPVELHRKAGRNQPHGQGIRRSRGKDQDVQRIHRRMLARSDGSFRHAAENRAASRQAYQVSHGCKSNARRADPDASALQQISQLCESRTGNRKIRVLRPQQHSHEECAEGCSGYIPGYGKKVKREPDVQSEASGSFLSVFFFQYPALMDTT